MISRMIWIDAELMEYHPNQNLAEPLSPERLRDNP